MLSLGRAIKTQLAGHPLCGLAVRCAPSPLGGRCLRPRHAAASGCAVPKRGVKARTGTVPGWSRCGSRRRQRLGAVSQRAVESRQWQRKGLGGWCRVNEGAGTSPEG